jgi:hypothetical protein
MTMIVLIGIALSLLGVAGLQFLYLSWLEQVNRSNKKRITELEHRCMYLNDRLFESELDVKNHAAVLAENNLTLEPDEEIDEVWADVIIDER